MGGKKSRDKGIRGELEACKLFSRWFSGVKRTGEIQRANNYPDLFGGVDKHYYVEVKLYKKIWPCLIRKWERETFNKWWKYGHDIDEFGTQPLVVYREDYGDWFVQLWIETPECTEPYYWLCQPWQDFADVLDRKFKVRKM